MVSGIIYPSNPLLKKHIEYFWYLKSGGENKAGFTSLPPEPRSEILFSFAGPTNFETPEKETIDLNGSFMMPLRKARLIVTSQNRVDYLAVRLYPHALYNFLNIPMSEFEKSAALEMELIDNKYWGHLTEKLYCASEIADRIKVLEDAFVMLLERRGTALSSQLIEPVISHMNLTCGRLNIKAISEQYGLGSKKLERMFCKHIGMTPKSYSRIVRFNSVFNYLQGGAINKDWAELAVRYGYYDQSHFIREFTEFAGYSPENYLKIRTELCC